MCWEELTQLKMPAQETASTQEAVLLLCQSPTFLWDFNIVF